MAIWSALTLLQRCLLGSILVHVIVLGVRMADPQGFDKLFKDTGLEVILANAQSEQNPEVAKAIAQFSLSGGGSLDQGRAASPLQAELKRIDGDDTEDRLQNLEQMQAIQNQLLAQLREKLKAEVTPSQMGGNAVQANANHIQKMRQRLKLLAEIERRVIEENERPKKRFISPATMGKVHATYYQEFKQRVEDLGTKNFPQVAGKKLYGELTVSISLDRNGAVIEAKVLDSNGDARLEKMALAIVGAGAPYGNFSEAMLKQFQILVVITRFKFTNDNTLNTAIVNNG